jgi:hypothetical protein
MTKDDYERLAADAAGRFVFGESETSRSYPANASGTRLRQGLVVPR